MNNDLEIHEKDDYLLVNLVDSVITVDRAQTILARIGEECARLHYTKVLLDERSVQKREVSSPDIMKLSQDMVGHGLREVYIAFWCQPHLINKDSEMLSLFTYTTKYIVRHFAEEGEALKWLNVNPVC